MSCPDHMGTLQLDGERIRQKQVVSPDLFHIFVFIEGVRLVTLSTTTEFTIKVHVCARSSPFQVLTCNCLAVTTGDELPGSSANNSNVAT